MAFSSYANLQVHGSFQNPFIFHGLNHLKTSLSSSVKPLFKELQQLLPRKVDVSKTMKNTSGKMLDALVDSIFQFVDQPLLPSQKNFAPVEEIGDHVEVTWTEGEIPADFAEGVFIRNGINPLFGGLKSAVSIFRQTQHTWVEGEGMLHALYFKKDHDGSWIISYNNRYVETETFKLEKQKHNKPCFLPALEGDAAAVVAAYILNGLRFGTINKHLSNTNKAPNSGKLVIMGVDAKKPYYVLGVISADGKLLHKVDLEFKRSTLSHDIGVTQKYNVIIDHPLTVDVKRVTMGGPLLKYEKEEYARIGVMPRYGDAESVKWFEVQTNCTFHILNCFEEANEVVVRGCRALTSFLPGPDGVLNKYEWFSKGFNFADDHSAETGYLFSRLYEWRLNMVSGNVEERNLTGTDFSMDFPFINEQVTGLKHKYGYTQVIDSMASSDTGMGKYGSLAKLYLEESNSTSFVEGKCEDLIKVEYHKFEEKNFCSGSVFVARHGGKGMEEDDGWIVTFVHNEETDVTQVHVIDAKKFESEPIAKLTLPQRVPYGFHATFVSMPCQS
ncbi:hypothetical protein PRUPE_1G449300 [Prunus persica]|uniref:Carotenoid 9,10(9',10')-cleavage dioxygenase 1-like n=1 Tax=Prunus persica TaxID=3760 RepID=A0A251RCV1_PRUPE|nr:hypothetical protein PRUPE_1G449300 [Prunus persica]